MARTVLIILLAVIQVSCHSSESADEETETLTLSRERVPAPSMELSRLDGETFRLADYRGKVVVLNFWATWCPPCRVELPQLAEIHRTYQERGVEVIGISMDEAGLDHVLKFSETAEIPYPIALGAFSEMEKLWAPLKGIPTVEGFGTESPKAGTGSVQLLPTTFIIDQAGRIVTKHVGPREREQLVPELEALLARPAES